MTWLPLIVGSAFAYRLSVIDARQHRLPNRLVGVMTVVVAAVIAVAYALDAQIEATAGPLTTGLKTLGTYLIVYVASRGQFGMGDVKFGFPLGCLMGYYAPHQWLTSIVASFLLAAAVAAIGLATGRINRHSRIAFGPYMALATVVLCTVSALP